MNCKNIMLTLGILSLGVVAPPMVEAAKLSPQEALSRVETFPTRFKMPGSGAYELTYTGKSEGEEALYVFNRGENGFIVVSADDRMPALLGYSDKGAFDVAKASPELKWWLSQYADEAVKSFHRENQFLPAPLRTPSTPRASIEPLLTTKWNQGSPFNNDCPEDPDGRCVTGCVATAMAQVMNYHKYPDRGTGSYSYTDLNGRTLSYDYSSATFDWTNMLDEYDENATEAQNAAVANLMYACGVGVNMDYHSYGSGAMDLYVSYALKTYFKYDAGVRFLQRNYFSNEEWEEIIYTELAANRPVVYGGQANSGGHEFVCDGYDDNGYFHINWGWGGYCDGYFLLSLLNPEGQGIGGFEGGYNSDQSAIVGIQKPTGTSAPWYPIYADGSWNVGLVDQQYLEIVFDPYCGMYNYSPEPCTLDFYLKAVSENEEEYFSDEGLTLSLGILSGYSSFRWLQVPAGLAAGKYKCYLAFKTPEGNWQEVLMPYGCSKYVEINVDDEGNISVGEKDPGIKAEIKVTSFAPPAPDGKVKKGEETVFDITIENIGEIRYADFITLCVYQKGTEEVLIQNQINGVLLAAGESISGNVPLTFDLEPGEYDIAFIDKYEEKISDIFSLTIVPEDYIEAVGIALDITEVALKAGETVTLTATVVPDNATYKTVEWTTSNAEVATVENGEVTALSLGDAIITASCGGVSATCDVKVIPTQVESITLDITEVSLKAGETIILAATVVPDNATYKTVVWTTSNAEVATVENGAVTAQSLGDASITATCGDVSATCEVKVVPTLVETITISGESETLKWGKDMQLSVVVTPETATDKTVVWESSDSNVATIDKDGNVLAKNVGEVTISASAHDGSGVSATYDLVIISPEKGDANGDDLIDITDAVNIANHAVGNETEVFCFEAADVNNDNAITMGDASKTVTLVLNQPVESGNQATRHIPSDVATSDCLVMDAFDDGADKGTRISVFMDNVIDYVAIQADIFAPEGLRIVDLESAQGSQCHTMMFRSIDDRTVRVVIFNFDNKPFIASDEPLFRIVVASEADIAGELTLSNIIGADANARRHYLSATGSDKTNIHGVGISSDEGIRIDSTNGGIIVKNAADSEVSIHTVNGVLIARFIARENVVTVNLDKGAYIVTAGTKVKKVMIK